MNRIISIFLFVFYFSNVASGAEDYEFYISTMEVVDKDADGSKDGLEIFYIFKDANKNIKLNPDSVPHIEAYLYEDKEKEGALMSFWRIDTPDGFFSKPIIYLPFREGFAYNVYRDKIIRAFLTIKIIFNDGREAEADIREKLSFLSY